ncbi:MAG: family protein phosphatase [Pseudomonadota bacterium]|nr:family protein phosphatase [Pseudomonadota bacterium]MDQ5915198.1 family protein phosphatase [Pseudomonadota bacterium]MDQ5919157.1 family protein phosphatase [Pseudomonadota bacterium]MDQ5944937.1 family protein phosphatase [Pseudomonadota bacterium]
MGTSLSEALEIVVKTDPGMVRSHNEDAVFGNPHRGLVILADGMGGYNAGEVASGMATTVLSTELEAAFAARSPDEEEADGALYAHAAIVDRVTKTNTAIFNAAESQPQYAGMGTTLVLALFHDNKLTAAHIGDSRLYRLREGDFRQLTRDHSLLQEQIDAGMISVEDARHSQNKNLVTRALGVDPEVETELHDHDVLPGDIYLLCSDGLNDMVEDEETALTLQALGANLELAATQLIQMANDNGGRDNVSVILVKVLREFPAAKGWWAKLLNWFK